MPENSGKVVQETLTLVSHDIDEAFPPRDPPAESSAAAAGAQSKRSSSGVIVYEMPGREFVHASNAGQNIGFGFDHPFSVFHGTPSHRIMAWS